MDHKTRLGSRTDVGRSTRRRTTHPGRHGIGFNASGRAWRRQQDASSTRETQGLGLGLSIAKQLVELHGGVITALSPGDGHGSTFIVTVPAVGHIGEAAGTTSSGETDGSAVVLTDTA